MNLYFYMPGCFMFIFGILMLWKHFQKESKVLQCSEYYEL